MIIVPVDGSTHSLSALHFAVTMAKSFECKLLLLNIQAKKDTNFSFENVADQQWEDEKMSIGKKQLEEAISFLDGKVEFETKIRIGIPSIEITSEAKDIDAKSIVMGSRGNGPVVSAILGSVSYGVLHLSPCPVTVVPSIGDK